MRSDPLHYFSPIKMPFFSLQKTSHETKMQLQCNSTENKSVMWEEHRRVLPSAGCKEGDLKSMNCLLEQTQPSESLHFPNLPSTSLVTQYPSVPVVAKHPALRLAEQAPTLSTQRPSYETHLLCDPQSYANLVAIIHNVPMREGGSFGASCCPLKDREHSAMKSPF